MTSVNKEEIQKWFMSLQDDICKQLESIDSPHHFIEDNWNRQEGGGGRSRIIKGDVFEKGGVNFSAVHGPTPKKILEALKLDQSDFYATGVSIVMHPRSPMVPIIHMNVRYFEMSNGVYWFGGGIDLTPHYVNEPDARFFHESLKGVCDAYDSTYHSRFKEWADDYFYIKHRKETRGVGGIFFDRLSTDDQHSKLDRFNFVKEVGKLFAPVYSKLVLSNKDKSYDDEQSHWQRLRRGRYAEFNLVLDKGTKFGLDTDGRIESILMSLPPEARWDYNVIPKPNSEEEKTQSLLKKGINWTN